jgi:GT2 family glycosyltransferase
MREGKFPPVTVAIVTHNRRHLLDACLAAVAAQEPRPAEVLVVDNGSTDGTAEHVRAHHRSARLVALARNGGPAAARNRALTEARTELVLLLDEDIRLLPGALAGLLAAVADPDAAAAAPLIVYGDRPDVVQYGGFAVHYLCVGIVRAGRLTDFEGAPPFVVTAVAGGAMLVRRSAASAVGGFDETFFFGREDGEFCARLTQAGWRCLQVPAAVARHEAQPRTAHLLQYQVRNRWLYMLRLYAARTLFLAAPALAAYEVALALLLLATGNGVAYLHGMLGVARTLRATLAARRRTQALRRVADADWLTVGPVAPVRALALTARISRAGRVLNVLADGYWELVRPLLAAPAPRSAAAWPRRRPEAAVEEASPRRDRAAA